MLAACSRSPGYLFSTGIPPRVDGEEFHIVFSASLRRRLSKRGAVRDRRQSGSNSYEFFLITIRNIASSTQRTFGFQPQVSKARNSQRTGGWPS
jgi:hypothetical protein